MIETHEHGGFGPNHLPYGSFWHRGEWRLGARLGDDVVDLTRLARSDRLPEACATPDLNALLSEKRSTWDEVRKALISEVSSAPDLGRFTVERSECKLGMPFSVADYVDFYSFEGHASNVGRMFRPQAPPLLPNWKALPVAYHGRSGTVIVDGGLVKRPTGQWVMADGTVCFGPSTKLDIELELGFVLGAPTEVGHPVRIEDVGEHIFGVVLLNDWSARDIQSWEYRPLGPFLGKSFATSIAAWVTPLSALEPYRVAGPQQLPEPLPYLRTDEPWALDLEVAFALETQRMREAYIDPFVISHANYGDTYWSMAQQVAHLTVNGASIRAGDLCGSGTISGFDPGSYGSLLEVTWDGTEPLSLPDGSSRLFLEDGDRVILTAHTPDGQVRLGSVSGTIAPGL